MLHIFSGIIIKGLGLGKKLGFPTLNLDPEKIPKTLSYGIYAVQVHTPLGDFNGVAHYGPRPAVKACVSFEVHCLGLKKNIYGKHVTVEVKKKIRSVKNFPTLVALKKAIENDIKKTRNLNHTFRIISYNA